LFAINRQQTSSAAGVSENGAWSCPDPSSAIQYNRQQRPFSRAKEYAELYRGSTPIAHFLNKRMTLILDRLASMAGGRLLDAGCGPGILLSRLAGGKFELFGVDSSPEMIREANAIVGAQNARFAVARLDQLPYPSEFFDVILALGVLEYVTELEAALTELMRIAKPNAIILVSMLNRESIYWRWELHIYRAWTALKSLLSGREPEPFEMPSLCTKDALMGVMKKCQMEALSVEYYNVNVSVEPFARRHPELASRINQKIESYKLFSRLVHTGFIIMTLKQHIE
jgi:2-polyprenyl-3-methyl-5-hydroxy-6-metoxy-1,4-benzoquinol methylase